MARKTRVSKKSKKARVTRNRRLAKFQLGGGEDDMFNKKIKALVDNVNKSLNYTYKENGIIKKIPGGYFYPIFSNHSRPPGDAGTNFYMDKLKESIKLINEKPYSYMFDGGYIMANTLRLGVSQKQVIVSHKKPSLNTAAFFSKKKLAKEFWDTLEWDGMSEELKTLSKNPSPEP